MYVHSKESIVTKMHNGERAIPMNLILGKSHYKLVQEKRSEKYVFATTTGIQINERRKLEMCKEIAERPNIYIEHFCPNSVAPALLPCTMWCVDTKYKRIAWASISC